VIFNAVDDRYLVFADHLQLFDDLDEIMITNARTLIGGVLKDFSFVESSVALFKALESHCSQVTSQETSLKKMWTGNYN